VKRGTKGCFGLEGGKGVKTESEKVARGAIGGAPKKNQREKKKGKTLFRKEEAHSSGARGPEDSSQRARLIIRRKWGKKKKFISEKKKHRRREKRGEKLADEEGSTAGSSFQTRSYGKVFRRKTEGGKGFYGGKGRGAPQEKRGTRQEKREGRYKVPPPKGKRGTQGNLMKKPFTLPALKGAAQEKKNVRNYPDIKKPGNGLTENCGMKTKKITREGLHGTKEGALLNDGLQLELEPTEVTSKEKKKQLRSNCPGKGREHRNFPRKKGPHEKKKAPKPFRGRD